MKKRLMDFLELACFAIGAFLIFYIVVDRFFTWVHFVVSPQLCLIAGVALVGVGFVIQSSSKKS